VEKSLGVRVPSLAFRRVDPFSGVDFYGNEALRQPEKPFRANLSLSDLAPISGVDLGGAKAIALLEDVPLRLARTRFVFPQTKTATIRILVLAGFDSFRQFLEAFGVAAAEHNIIGDE
jgi:hypothetical protein